MDVYEHNFPNNDDPQYHECHNDADIDSLQPNNDGHRNLDHDLGIDKLQPNYDCDYNGNLDNIQSDDDRDRDHDSYYYYDRKSDLNKLHLNHDRGDHYGDSDVDSYGLNNDRDR